MQMMKHEEVSVCHLNHFYLHSVCLHYQWIVAASMFITRGGWGAGRLLVTGSLEGFQEEDLSLEP